MATVISTPNDCIINITNTMNYTYEVKPHQKELAQKINRLNKNNLYNLVVQQHHKRRNLTLNELKKYIKKGIKDYCKGLYGYQYKEGLENELIQYVCIFETNEAFNKTQFKSLSIDTGINFHYHFHLFISTKKSEVSMSNLLTSIINSLMSNKLKSDALYKVDYAKIENFTDDFSYYHTKQFQERKEVELLLLNI